MRRIPTAAQKEELKGLLKKQYEEAIESILQFIHQDAGNYSTNMETR